MKHPAGMLFLKNQHFWNFGTCPFWKKVDFLHIWYIFGTYLVHIWYVDGTWMVRGWYVDGTWMVREWYVNGTWMVRGWYVDGTWIRPQKAKKGPMRIILKLESIILDSVLLGRKS